MYLQALRSKQMNFDSGAFPETLLNYQHAIYLFMYLETFSIHLITSWFANPDVQNTKNFYLSKKKNTKNLCLREPKKQHI